MRVEVQRGLRTIFQKARLAMLLSRRHIEMRAEEQRSIGAHGKITAKEPRLFNLDLHIGVIADLKTEFLRQGADITTWSISSHNHLVPNRISCTDPVRHVNAWSWRSLDENKIDRFQDRYGKFLRTFDGFVCTYSPTFAELFRGLDRPTFIMAATRYETPYSGQPDQWNRFNVFLRTETKAGRVHLYANNHGDADYLRYFTGLDVQSVPSLCERDPERWIGASSNHVVLSRDEELVARLERETARKFRDIAALGAPYQWVDLLNCQEVFVVPQNISTMTLFELATAGVPVAVPDRPWLHELRREGWSALGELTFHEIAELPPDAMPDSPANYSSEHFLDWWLDRADFFDSDLMPNVRQVSSIADLAAGPNAALRIGTQYWDLISARNARVREQRQVVVSTFLDACR